MGAGVLGGSCGHSQGSTEIDELWEEVRFCGSLGVSSGRVTNQGSYRHWVFPPHLLLHASTCPVCALRRGLQGSCAMQGLQLGTLLTGWETIV